MNSYREMSRSHWSERGSSENGRSMAFFCWRFFNGENDEPLALGIPMDALFSGKAIYSCEMLYIYLLDVYGIDLPFSFVGS